MFRMNITVETRQYHRRCFQFSQTDLDSVTIIIIQILKVRIVSEGIMSCMLVTDTSVDGIDGSDVVAGVMKDVLCSVAVWDFILVAPNTDRRFSV